MSGIKGKSGVYKRNLPGYWKGKKNIKLSEKLKGRSINPNTQFKKGYTPWHKGRKGVYSKKTLDIMSELKLGKKKGPRSEETKRKIREKLIGIKHTEQRKENMRKAQKTVHVRGDKHPNWKGGISKINYPEEFNSRLKLKIRIRDNYMCCLCGKTEREELEELNRVLCVNHIDFNKNNCKEENLNSLCLRCNVKINRERDYWTNYFKII